jgi:zinc transporter 1/2/3
MADVAEAAVEAEDVNGETMPLRIAAVFIIMVVSLLGCLFPLLVLDLNGRAKFGSNIPLTPSSRNKSDGERVFHGAHAMHLLKSFSAGIILCVGFVHVLAEANETLGDLVDFPLAHFVAMMGSIVVLALSQVVDGLVTSMAERGKPPGPSAGAAGGPGIIDLVDLVRGGTGSSLSKVVISAPDSTPSKHAPYCFPEDTHEHDDLEDQHDQQHHHEQQHHLTPSQRQFLLAAGGNATDSDSSSEAQHGPSPTLPTPSSRSKKPVGLSIDPPPPPTIPDMSPAVSEDLPKSYPFVSPRAQSSLKTALAARVKQKEQQKELVRHQSTFGRETPRGSQSHAGHDHGGGGGHNDAVHVVQAFKKHSLVIAYIMEVGIVFHSVLIGIGLGTATSSVSNTKTLLVAISVHQFFEGAGLSTCILEAGLPRKKNAIMFGLFSITTSLGIAVGIGISKIYDEGSRAAALVEGTFNAFAAGILIYLALVDILQEEFNRREVKKHKIWQIQMMMCVLLGAGVMSVIAIWA